MVYFEDAPRLRELCEKASKEYDHEKLLDLVRQINELLEKKRRIPGLDNLESKAFSFVSSSFAPFLSAHTIAETKLPRGRASAP